MADLDAAELRRLGRDAARDLHAIVRSSTGDSADQLAWRLRVLARHLLAQLPKEPSPPRIRADTTPRPQ